MALLQLPQALPTRKLPPIDDFLGSVKQDDLRNLVRRAMALKQQRLQQFPAMVKDPVDIAPDEGVNITVPGQQTDALGRPLPPPPMPPIQVAGERFRQRLKEQQGVEIQKLRAEVESRLPRADVISPETPSLEGIIPPKGKEVIEEVETPEGRRRIIGFDPEAIQDSPFNIKADAPDPTEEAKKFDSAEKFIEAQGNIVYHGSEYSGEDLIPDGHPEGEATWFSSDAFSAEGYGDKIHETLIKPKNPLVHDAKGKSWVSVPQTDILKKAKKDGHDAVIFKNIVDNKFGGSASDVTAVLDSSVIKKKNIIDTQADKDWYAKESSMKAQLTTIFTQAKGKGK